MCIFNPVLIFPFLKLKAGLNRKIDELNTRCNIPYNIGAQLDILFLKISVWEISIARQKVIGVCLMCEPASHASHASQSASHASHAASHAIHASQGASLASHRFNVKNNQIRDIII